MLKMTITSPGMSWFGKVKKGAPHVLLRDAAKHFNTMHRTWKDLALELSGRLATRIVREIKRTLRDQDFPGASIPLNDDYLKRKGMRGLSTNVLQASLSLIDSVHRHQTGEGYIVSFDGTSSSPFGGTPLPMAQLAMLLDQGSLSSKGFSRIQNAKKRSQQKVRKSDFRIPAREFMASAVETATAAARKQLDAAVGDWIVTGSVRRKSAEYED